MSRRRRLRVLSLVGALLLPLLPTLGRAQEGRPYSVDQVAEAVASGLDTRMLEQARANCISFIVDAATTAQLRAAGAAADFTSALRDVCYVGTSLDVRTEPAGAEVWVQDRHVGKSPWVSPMAPVRNAVVEVRLGGKAQRVTTDILAGQLVRVDFTIPRDTMELPPVPSDQELRTLRAQVGDFDPTRPRPAPPSAPTRGGSLKAVVGAGLLGAAGGAGVGTLLCNQDVAVYTVETIGGIPVRTQAGTERKLQGACLGFSAGGGAVVGGLAGKLWSNASFARRRRQYAEDLRIYDRQLALWEQQRRAAELLRQAEGRRTERDRVAALNERIKAENGRIGQPRVSAGPAARIERAVLNYTSQ